MYVEKLRGVGIEVNHIMPTISQFGNSIPYTFE
jgi:hypothetical protein